MKRQDILKLFRQFLIKHDALVDFVDTSRDEEMVYIQNASTFIIASFDWGNHTTKWSLLNKLWIEELKQKGIEC